MDRGEIPTHTENRIESQSTSSLIQRIFWNETGQMSIFIALIFQVLFVFFAMVINVGLLVHDKINLQNAVDLAAYYGAQRQAELLNEIAHINYQLRQDYKLLAWRYRVVGTLGRHGTADAPTEQTLPPARKNNPGSLTDIAWVNPDYPADEPASVCVSNQMWKEMVENSSQEESYCHRPYGSTIPKIPDAPQVAPFVPGVAEAAAFTKMAQDLQRQSCQNAGPRNWVYTMQMIYAYKLAIATRKQFIKELRRNLIAAEPKDRNNESVKDGVLKTLQKNLTYANLAGFQGGEFKYINSMANANCNRGDDGEFIMPEILTAPALTYTYYLCEEGTTPNIQSHELQDGLDPAQVAKYDPSGLFRNLAKGEPEATNMFHSTLGFEKNPWCMAYVGVKAKTKTHKPFAPLGNPITLEARGFAQPFGGRVGPWYKSGWTRGAPTSADGARVDPLTSPRQNSDGGMDGGGQARMPNYSRYPGDKLGLKSAITMGAQNALIRGYSPPVPKANRLSLTWYTKFDGIPVHGDVLAQAGTSGDNLRRAEVAAVSPDLFDAIYYSIDPNYWDNYINHPERFANLQPIFGQTPAQISDIGGNMTDGIKMTTEFQIRNSVTAGGFDQTVLPKLYYVIRAWPNLLTGWVQQSALNYTFPVDKFGKCEEVAGDDVMIPGKCAVGGRVGYSVRFVSKAHLTQDKWTVGGESEGTGAILNPPPPDF